MHSWLFLQSSVQFTLCVRVGWVLVQCRERALPGNLTMPLKQGHSLPFHLSSCCFPASDLCCSKKELLSNAASSRELLLMDKKLHPPLIPCSHLLVLLLWLFSCSTCWCSSVPLPYPVDNWRHMSASSLYSLPCPTPCLQEPPIWAHWFISLAILF